MPRPRNPAGHQAEGPGAAAGGEGRAPDLWLEEDRLSCWCIPRHCRPARCTGLETWLSVPAVVVGAVTAACGCCPPRRGGPGVPVSPPGGWQWVCNMHRACSTLGVQGVHRVRYVSHVRVALLAEGCPLHRVCPTQQR